MSQQPRTSITLQGMDIIKQLSLEELQQFQADLQGVVDRWYRIKFSQLTMMVPGMNSKYDKEAAQDNAASIE